MMDTSLLNAPVEEGTVYLFADEDVHIASSYAAAKISYDAAPSNGAKGIFVMVKYGNLAPMLTGRDTNVSPYKEDYQAMKDMIRANNHLLS